MRGNVSRSIYIAPGLLLFLNLFVFPATLLADRILLKNGQTLEGQFIGEEGETVIIKTEQGKHQILSSEIEEVKLGLSGMRLCYQLRKDGTNICDDLFRGIKSGFLIFIQAPHFDQERKLPLASLSRVEIWPERDMNVLGEIDLVSANGKVTLHNGVAIAGSMQKQSDKIVVQGNAGTLDVASRSIAHLELDLAPVEKAPLANSSRFLRFIPGYSKWQNGSKVLGGIQGGLFLSGAGLAVFHGIGMRTAAAQASDPSTWLFYNKSHRQAYNAHATGFKFGSSLALGMLAWNLTDILFFQKKPQAVLNERNGTFTIGTRILPRENKLDRISYFSYSIAY
ncbi:MAG: hypothetical protein K8S54_02435 [Spirochaetia bacterium]|nr:hypothetical protein [Spirochaetia bacterium]